MERKPSYSIKPLTGVQRLLCDVHAEAKSYWLMPCWTEVRLDRIHEIREAQSANNQPKITYTAYFVKAIADAVRSAMPAHPEFNAALARLPWRRMIYFENVDAAVAVERPDQGEDCFFVGIIRDADRKLVSEIAEELRRMKRSDPGDKAALEKERRLTRWPGLVRKAALMVGRNVPAAIRKYRGTLFLSTVGKYGVGMYLMSNHNLSFSFGEVSRRPVVVKDKITIAPATTLTVVYDHRAMMGAPVARLMSDIRNRLETGRFT